jgi:hypothetical protein
MHDEGIVLVESERLEDLHGSHSGKGWVYVAVEDVDGHYERTKAAGVHVLNERHDAMDGAQRGYSARDLGETYGVLGRQGRSGSRASVGSPSQVSAWSKAG